MTRVGDAARDARSPERARQGGARAPRGARAEDLKLTASQREILWQLHEYRILTPRLLALVYGAKDGREGRGWWHLLRQLRVLHDAGLVVRLRSSRIKSGGGSEEFIYKLTDQGARAILPADECAVERRRLRIEARSDRAHVDHSLAVSTLQVILSLGQAEWRLAEFRRDDRRVRVDDTSANGAQDLTVWPDASAIIERSNAIDGKDVERVRFLFEMDLARKNDQRVRDRFLAYMRCIVDPQAGNRRAANDDGSFQSDGLVVVMVAPNESEVERLLKRVAEAVPSRDRGDAAFLFWNSADWYEANEMGSRRLRSPRAIVADRCLTTMHGESRCLV